jgi:hypothetical protein
VATECVQCEQQGGTCPRHGNVIPFRRRPARIQPRRPQLAFIRPERQWTPEETTWNVRGIPRTRAEFGAPAPGDFPGGLPKPPEYPV